MLFELWCRKDQPISYRGKFVHDIIHYSFWWNLVPCSMNIYCVKWDFLWLIRWYHFWLPIQKFTQMFIAREVGITLNFATISFQTRLCDMAAHNELLFRKHRRAASIIQVRWKLYFNYITSPINSIVIYKHNNVLLFLLILN